MVVIPHGTHDFCDAGTDAVIGRPLARNDAVGSTAHAVINVRFSTSAVTAGAAEIYAYGTAVIVEAIGAQTSASPAEAAGTSPIA